MRADRRAAAALLEAADRNLETIEGIWRWALQQPDWPRIETLADLSQHWGRVAPRALAVRKKAASDSIAGIRAPDSWISCPPWADLASDLKRRLRPDLFGRWFAPVSVAVDGGDLLVIAPDEFHREFLQDNYREFLEQEIGARAQQKCGHEKLNIRIVTAQPASAAAASL